jgi:ABC-type sugar transport system substrate-binding protein
MEDFISSYGDQISILIGYDDDLTMGGVQAISEAGLTDSIKVYSFTGQKDAIQAVIDGQMELTVMNRATDIGAGLVSAIGEYFSTGSTTYYQRTPLTYITADNAADYLDKAEF